MERNQQLDRESIIRMLKAQRNQIDDTLLELGGVRFNQDLFDADTTNDMIQAKFDDVLSALRKGDYGLAKRWAKEGAEKEWLEIS